MVWLYALREKSSGEVARCMYIWFSLNSSLCTIYYDNRTKFQGDFDDLVKNRNPFIPVIRGRAYYPQSQGSIKVYNREFKRYLAALRIERSMLSWLQLLPELQEVTNTTGSYILPNHIILFEVWFGCKPY